MTTAPPAAAMKKLLSARTCACVRVRVCEGGHGRWQAVAASGCRRGMHPALGTTVGAPSAHSCTLAATLPSGGQKTQARARARDSPPSSSWPSLSLRRTAAPLAALPLASEARKRFLRLLQTGHLGGRQGGCGPGVSGVHDGGVTSWSCHTRAANSLQTSACIHSGGRCAGVYPPLPRAAVTLAAPQLFLPTRCNRGGGCMRPGRLTCSWTGAFQRAPACHHRSSRSRCTRTPAPPPWPRSCARRRTRRAGASAPRARAPPDGGGQRARAGVSGCERPALQQCAQRPPPAAAAHMCVPGGHAHQPAREWVVVQLRAGRQRLRAAPAAGPLQSAATRQCLPPPPSANRRQLEPLVLQQGSMPLPRHAPGEWCGPGSPFWPS